MTGTESLGLPSGTGPEPGERDHPHPTPPTPTGAPRLSGPNMIARTTPASRPSPSRGGLRPAWTPTPHTRTSTHARKTRKTAPAHPNQDLTGPAPFMDDQHQRLCRNRAWWGVPKGSFLLCSEVKVP